MLVFPYPRDLSVIGPACGNFFFAVFQSFLRDYRTRDPTAWRQWDRGITNSSILLGWRKLGGNGDAVE